MANVRRHDYLIAEHDATSYAIYRIERITSQVINLIGIQNEIETVSFGGGQSFRPPSSCPTWWAPRAQLLGDALDAALVERPGHGTFDDARSLIVFVARFQRPGRRGVWLAPIGWEVIRGTARPYPTMATAD